MKILEAWIQKFLAWTKRLPVTKAKIDRLPFSRFYKLLAATVTDCPLKLILSFWYPAIRLKTKFSSNSFLFLLHHHFFTFCCTSPTSLQQEKISRLLHFPQQLPLDFFALLCSKPSEMHCPYSYQFLSFPFLLKPWQQVSEIMAQKALSSSSLVTFMVLTPLVNLCP